jgi:hypothetical protein
VPSVAHVAPAAPALGAAQRHRFAEREREEVEVLLFGGLQYSYATALYCVEWHREYGSDPDDLRGYDSPSVTLCDLLSESGTSLLNAAGRRQCRAIERQLEEHEANHGPPVPYRFSFHYD